MKRFLLACLCALCLTISLATPAAAVRTVPVTVDGALLTASARLENGASYIPLRALLTALGGWTVRWDGAAGCAAATDGTDTVTACPADGQLSVNGGACGGGVTLADGTTYVPLRTLCRALGLAVSWDGSLGGAAVSTGAAASAGDLYWLSRIISAESQGESLTGQIAVGNVVLNRVASSDFPDTIRAVVFDTRDGVQFEPVSNGTVYDEPTAQSVAAARAALSGTSVVGKCLYFYAPALSQGTWIRTHRTYYTTIGCHRFYL